VRARSFPKARGRGIHPAGLRESREFRSGFCGAFLQMQPAAAKDAFSAWTEKAYPQNGAAL